MLSREFFYQLEDTINRARYEIDEDYHMTPISRLKDKLGKAAGVAQRVATTIEAEADSLIAQEDAMKSKTANAFAPHRAILAEANTELQAIEDALNLMSNGGPSINDPLESSKISSPLPGPYPTYP